MSSEQTTEMRICATDITPEAFEERMLTFGSAAPFRFQSLVFAMADMLMPCYRGGKWQFRELSNGGFYAVPPGQGPVQVEWHGNYFSRELSTDAAGIVTSLFALCALCEQMAEEPKSDELIDAYGALRSYAGGHAEAEWIFAAID